MTLGRREVLAWAAVAPAFAVGSRASAAAPVKIGGLYPLTGNSAGAGRSARPQSRSAGDRQRRAS